MACSDNTCGTSTWLGPKPGDPDNNSVLSATPAFGGIDVSWTYPTLNSAAVAYTRLYRGLTADFLSAMQIRIVSGDFYHDKLDQAIEYFYWIRIVSVNWTEGDSEAELIGPVSAVAKPNIDAFMELMTDKIDSGNLSQALKTEIARISTIDNALIVEITNREDSHTLLGTALTAVQADLDAAVSFVGEETTQRVAADGVLAQQINLVQSSLGDDLASAQTTLQTNIETVAGEVTNIGALYTAKVSVNGLVGGFGIYNDGTEVEAGFDVDKFWVGRTQANKRKPFIIQDGVTYIDEAVINKLTFDKLRATDGSFIVENGKVKADYLTVNSIRGGAYTGYAWPAAGNYGFYLGPEGLLLGNANNNKYFQVTSEGNIYSPQLTIFNGVATYSGSLNAASGTYSGTLTADAINAVNTINLAGQAVTIPLGVGYTNSVVTSGADITVCQVGPYTSTGAPVFVTGDAICVAGWVEDPGGNQGYLHLKRNGVTLVTKSFSITSVSLSVAFVDNPPAGQVTYTLVLSKGGFGSAMATTRNLFSLECKR